ncbi:MAG: ferrochelatase [Elusimicrobiota bacterium]
MNAPTKAAVLLMGYGAPRGLDDVPAYLSEMRGDRSMPEPVVREVTERYRRIGGSSPLPAILERVRESLQESLGGPYDVYLGMRYGEPSLRSAVEGAVADGHANALALPLSPYQSRMTDEAYLEKARACAAAAGGRLAFFPPPAWHAHPLLVRAYAERLRETLSAVPEANRGRTFVLFTAHSLPASIVEEGDPYAEQLRLTCAAVAQEAGISEWMLAYQSRPQSQAPGAAWLGPEAGELIDAAAGSGADTVVLDPVGFLADNLETLYDDDVLLRERAERKGLSFHRVAALNDDVTYIRALAAVVRASFAPLS